MRFPYSSPRLQRFLGGSVAALLTANAFAIGGLVGGDEPAEGLRRPAPADESLAPALELPPTVAMITTTDGRTFTADPSTADGRRAIAQARRDGSTVREVTAPARRESPEPGSSITIPSPVNGDGLLDLRKVIGGLAGATTPDDDQDDSGVLEVGSDLVDDTVTTVTSLVDDTATTVTSLVEDTTITDPVEETVTTVVTLLGQTTSSTQATTTTTTTTTTTAPPAEDDDPICLLVLC